MQFGMPTLVESPSIEQSLTLCSELGLDFVELNMNLPEYQLDRIDAVAVKRLFNQHGKYPTIHLDENLNVCDVNIAIANTYVNTVIQTISLAKELSAPIINMHMPDGVYFTLPDKRLYLFELYKSQYLEKLQQFREVCTDAIGTCGILLCIENSGVYQGFQREGIDILLEKPCFALTYDIGHDFCVGKSNETFIINHVKKLKHIHLHDAAEKHSHLILGSGEIDVAAALALAHKHNCRCVIEIKTIDGLRQSVRYLKKMENAAGDSSVLNTVASTTVDSSAETVTDSSSNAEKLDVFQSLFRGREDVHARKWKNKNAYSPACYNFWKTNVCGKRRESKISCDECKNTEYIPLNRAALALHFKGKEVIGIYPLLPDETCLFLAIDFDKGEWSKDIAALRAVCESHKIPLAVERSRSGNGAHAWFFFNKPVHASAARKFGSALLSTAMERRHEIRFSSYDRFFPSQDTLPKGGFGNLIALPLQREARDNGNSVFIDEKDNPYSDQWAYLSGLQRISADELNKYTVGLSKSGELGSLRTESDENGENPWDKKRQVKLTTSDFPLKARIVKTNMLFIDKDGFSIRALNRLKRVSAFSNPVFYRTQAVRESTWDRKIPRIISCSVETEQYLGLPRGCENDVIALLDKTPIQWQDERNKGRFIDVEFNGILRLEQGIALAEMQSHENGVLAATTASGKTIIGAALIAHQKINTLVLVDKLSLLDQWVLRLKEFLVINEPMPELSTKKGRKKQKSSVGVLGGSKNKLSGIIDIATYQSLYRGEVVKDIVKDYGMVIIDECHHVAAPNYERVLREVNAKYVYGLTATPKRQDGHHPIITMQCGDIRYKDDAKERAQNRPFEHYYIPRFTSYRLPIDKDDMDLHDIYADLCQHERRNDMIIADILQVVDEGRCPLILSDRLAHIELLENALKEKVPNLIVLTGGKSQKERIQQAEQVASIPDDQPFVIIATGKYVGEGFDAPRLDTLFLAMPFAWEGTLVQYAGRLHRLHDGKDEVLIYDYVDVYVARLENMYAKRIKGYSAIGYRAKCEGVIPVDGNIVYDESSFLPVFSIDILSAKREVVIVSPYLTQKRVAKMINMLEKCVLSGIQVSVITRTPENYEEKDFNKISGLLDYLNDKGINVTKKSKIHQKFAIIDDRIVWYGSINLLSYGDSEESIMRLESTTIAGELMSVMRE